MGSHWPAPACNASYAKPDRNLRPAHGIRHTVAVIRLVTFDLDNTLWGVDEVVQRAKQQTDAWLARRVPEYAGLQANERCAIVRQVDADNPDVLHDVSRRRELALRAELRHLGRPPAQAETLAAAALDEYLFWRHQVRFFPGALEVLAQLAQSYVLASLTNGNADFARLGLDRYFSFGYCAADVGAAKPDKAMFARAIDRAGVAPGEAVHVGDHRINDIQGAAGVGMATIWVNFDGKDDSVGASATVQRLADLPASIAAL